jgi:hypothetical protein
MVRVGVLGLMFKHLVMLHVLFMLLVSSPHKVFCQALDNCSLITKGICSFKVLMRGRRVL